MHDKRTRGQEQLKQGKKVQRTCKETTRTAWGHSVVGCRLPYLVSKAITILFRLFRLVFCQTLQYKPSLHFSVSWLMMWMLMIIMRTKNVSNPIVCWVSNEKRKQDAKSFTWTICAIINIIVLVLFTLNIVYTKYCLHKILFTLNIAHTKYCLHQIWKILTPPQPNRVCG